jgi:hypothetical protein
MPAQHETQRQIYRVADSDARRDEDVGGGKPIIAHLER